MISICMIITALATAALAKGSIECSFSEPTGARQCFGAVGQQLIFHLPNKANTEIRLIKDDAYMILKIVKNKIESPHKEYVNQLELFTNGTLKLGNAMKRHSGDYLMEQYGSNGTLLKKVIVHLEIREPVSKPAVSQMCVSPEEMEVSCSSQGDKVQFNLTLDGLLLVPTRGHSQATSNWTANTQSLAGNETDQDKASVSNVTISLQGQLTGNFMCSVQNKVSREETVIQLKRCHEPVSKPAVSQMCVSPEKMEVSCSSQGDEVEFNLTLDGLLLVPTRGHSQATSNWTANTQSLAGNETDQDKASVSNVTISLQGQLTGNFMCSVQNKVSREETVIQLKRCHDLVSFLSVVTVAVIAGGVAVLLLVSLCLCRIKFHNKARPTTVNEGNYEDISEIIYTNVRVTRRAPECNITFS